MSIKHWPEGERPREKLLALGAAHLSDAELLAILLRVGIQGMSAVDLARHLLSEFGSLHALMSADAAALCRHKGMGPAAFAQFATVREIGRRLLAAEMAATPLFDNPSAVADYLRLRLGAESVEVCLVLLLNQQHHLQHTLELTRGTVNESTVYVREVVTLALKHRAAALILAHNHPGGGSEPSAADIALTARLKAALDLVDVRLLDHFVVTAHTAVSMAERGLL
ncbi:DNA repair protein RadC [Neisseria sp. HSC-16F19]|nr:DNA repair protein RadC [Neisseria sp. HSC-16F19]MCP2041346.1 DNA repair protein RadC [Neisseria sp. HSC-16F19]